MTVSMIKTFHRLSLAIILVASVVACKDKPEKTDGAAGGAAQDGFADRAIEGFEKDKVVVNQAGSETDIEVQAVPEDDLQSVLSECGVDDLSNKDRPTFSTIMKYPYVRVINAGIAVANVNLTSILDLRGTLSATTLNVGVEVGTLTGTSELGTVSDISSIAKRAEDLARIYRGPMTNIAAERNAEFPKEWRGILCSMTKSISSKNARSGFVTEATYKPGFTPAISPIATRQRYEKELGEFKFFKNIQAKVTTTTNPLLKVGQVIYGSIFVEKIEPVKNTHLGVIRGDTAYRITNHFGSDQETLALGFHLWTEYYIDHAQKTFSAVIANVGDEEVMHFVGTYKGDGGGASKGGPTFGKEVGTLLTQSCAGCHNAQSKSRQDLSTYDGAKRNGSGLAERVKAGTMPPGAALSAEQKKLIADWAADGFPQ